MKFVLVKPIRLCPSDDLVLARRQMLKQLGYKQSYPIYMVVRIIECQVGLFFWASFVDRGGWLIKQLPFQDDSERAGLAAK